MSIYARRSITISEELTIVLEKAEPDGWCLYNSIVQAKNPVLRMSTSPSEFQPHVRHLLECLQAFVKSKADDWLNRADVLPLLKNASTLTARREKLMQHYNPDGLKQWGNDRDIQLIQLMETVRILSVSRTTGRVQENSPGHRASRPELRCPEFVLQNPTHEIWLLWGEHQHYDLLTFMRGPSDSATRECRYAIPEGETEKQRRNRWDDWEKKLHPELWKQRSKGNSADGENLDP